MYLTALLILAFAFPDAFPDALPDAKAPPSPITSVKQAEESPDIPIPTPKTDTGLSLVMVTSKTCAPCQKMKPILDRVGGKWTVNYVDFDDPDMKQLMEVYQITSVPYYVTYRGHEALEVADGLMSLEEILGWLGRLEQKLPPDPGGRFKRCTAQDSLTPADREYLQLQISPGSCKMLGCLTHPGAWVAKKLPDVPDEKKPPGHWELRSVQPAGGCPGGNCPSSGTTQKVWVADPDMTQFVPWPSQGVSGFGRRR